MPAVSQANVSAPSLQPRWTSAATASPTAAAARPTPTAASGATTRSASPPPATAPL